MRDRSTPERWSVAAALVPCLLLVLVLAGYAWAVIAWLAG